MTRGVARVVRRAGASAVIRDEEMASDRRAVAALAETGQEPQPAPDFRAGQLVRVVRGRFEGVIGRVRDLRGRKRLLGAIAQIGQGLEVEIPADALEPAD